MTWVLILWMWRPTYDGSMTIERIKGFPTKDACVSIGNQIITKSEGYVDYRANDYRANYVCALVEK